MYIIDFNKYPLPDRKRHHTNPNYYIPAKDLKFISDGYPTLINDINWSKIFINNKPPTMLDIGCGRGLFLLTIANENKNTNILGIEIRNWCCDWLSNYITSEQIKNCGIMHYGVGNGLHFINDNTIESIFYLFPDPWVKTKHIKRRAFNMDFLSEVARILTKNGELYIATDILSVHEDHIELLQKFKHLTFKTIKNDKEWNKPLTNKEIFCRDKNIPFYRIIASKIR